MPASEQAATESKDQVRSMASKEKAAHTFSKEETLRYSRHFVLPGFHEAAQQKLRQARILIVGAGGLGCPVLQYLTAAGAGTIGIVDHDTISLSNLQRQILFTTDDIGKSKARTAATRMSLLNPHVDFHVHEVKLTAHNINELIHNYDLLIDCTDNFPTRYLINDACVLASKPFIYGSLFRYEGQVAVFNYQEGPNYRDLYPQPPAPGSVPDCEAGGVLGVLAGIIGSWQASEAIKVITGIGEPLAGKLLLYDSLTSETTIVSVPHRDAKKSITALIDYEDFCGLSQKKSKTWGPENDLIMKEVTVQELKQLKDTNADFQLIDVREPHEFDICDIGGQLIPMADVPNHVEEIAKDKQVILHCRSGKRSGDILLWLEKNHGFENLYNLKGGILAWAKEIDPSMPVY